MSKAGDRTKKHPPKVCAFCGQLFYKRTKITVTQWEKATCCSNECLGRLRREPCISKGRWIVWVGDRKILRARAVMEKHLGRKLTEEEVVHHINADKLDDRIENLRLYASHAEHMRDEWREKKRNGERIGRFEPIPAGRMALNVGPNGGEPLPGLSRLGLEPPGPESNRTPWLRSMVTKLP